MKCTYTNLTTPTFQGGSVGGAFLYNKAPKHKSCVVSYAQQSKLVYSCMEETLACADPIKRQLCLKQKPCRQAHCV